MRSKFAGLLMIICVMAITTIAHTVPKEEVIVYINSKDVKQSACVETAEMQKDLPRLLVVEVGDCWFKLSEKERRGFAKKWHTLWRHSVANGIVSVIEKSTGTAVINFHPDGRIDLTK
ncbi:MAG: hypothetical protein FD167_2991 [bacterium]|nr:MAG: hypothetical protein FD167_2991 [bacterium]